MLFHHYPAYKDHRYPGLLSLSSHHCLPQLKPPDNCLNKLPHLKNHQEYHQWQYYWECKLESLDNHL